MPNADSMQPADRERIVGLLRWPLVVVAIAVVGGLIYVETLREARRSVEGLGDAASRGVEALAGAFGRERITETFVSALPEIKSTGGGNLELASIEAVETITRSEEKLALWDLVSLGTTRSEIRVPVTYRYHLRLEDPWQLEVADGTCIVHAPEIRATQPPAIDTSGMVKRLDEGLLQFDGADQMLELERSLTPRLRRMATDPRRLDLAREAARRTVAEFVRDWLLREEQWDESGFRSVIVVFPEEELRGPAGSAEMPELEPPR